MQRGWPILFILLTLFSCRSPFPEDRSDTVFRYNEFSNITSLDPAFAKDQANIWACNQLYNGLLQLDDRLNICPCIAKSWQIDSSGRVYTFHLRQDVFFHDHPAFTDGRGRRVTAEDFVYSFERLIDPRLAAPGAWVFGKVENDNSIPAFSALNDTTLQIRLKESFPPFLSILTMLYCSVVPKEVIAMEGSDFRKDPVGTGPFCFRMWKENVKLVLVKNKHYFEFEHGHRLPYLDAVAVTFRFDKQSAFLEFVKGKIDFISGLDQSYKDELLTNDGQLREKYRNRFIMLTQPYLNTEYVGILVDTSLEIVKNSPLRSLEIRKAINYGFDREKLIRYLRNNIGYPGIYGIIPPGLPAFDSAYSEYSYDPVRAKLLIKQAGYSETNPVPDFTLHTTAEYVDLFKYMQHELQNIGLKMNIEVNPAATLMQLKANSRINFFRASWIADYPDEESYLSLFTGKNFAPAGPNYTHYKNEVYDSLYERSQKNISRDERTGLYRQMDELMMDDAPVVVLYYDQVVRFLQKDISGLGTNPLNLLTLKRVKKLKANENN